MAIVLPNQAEPRKEGDGRKNAGHALLMGAAQSDLFATPTVAAGINAGFDLAAGCDSSPQSGILVEFPDGGAMVACGFVHGLLWIGFAEPG